MFFLKKWNYAISGKKRNIFWNYDWKRPQIFSNEDFNDNAQSNSNNVHSQEAMEQRKRELFNLAVTKVVEE